jgi:hypothetical protein
LLDADTLGDAVSLFFLVAAFLIVAGLAARAKTVKSFQFEIFVVLLVLVVSEVPHILLDLDSIVLPGAETFGLVVHTVSMVILVAFVSLRASKYFRQQGPGA